MARTISDEELQLKRRARRRLIGAIVLVTALIVVLPMVLDSEPKPLGRDVAVQIPSPGSGKFSDKLGQLPAPQKAKAAPPATDATPAEQGSGAGQSPPAAAAAAAEAQTATTAPAPVRKPKAAPAGSPAKAAHNDAQAVPRAEGRYVVQVIALADAAKAKSMRERMTASGIKAYTEVVKTAKGDVTRVRAGPFATREAAEKARERLKALGMNGNVTTK